MSIIGTIYEDVTSDVLGQIGIWQWLMVMASTAFMIPSMFNQYEDMFLLNPPVAATCNPSEGYDVFNTSLCTVTTTNNMTVACTKWDVKLLGLIWLKKTWLVFCDNEIKLLSTTMISRMGLTFGCVTFGLIADSFGRKPAIAIDLIAQLILGVTITFCDSQAWFQLLVFLKALFGAATMYMGLVITCEIASNSWRSCLSTIVCTPRLLTIAYMVPLVNSFPNLETYNFLASFFVILLIILLRWTPESPQWLLYNRKINQAEKILYDAAKRNDINLCKDFKIRPVNQRAYNCLDESRTCADLFTKYNTKMIILVLALFWIVTSFQLSYHNAKLLKEDPNHQYKLFGCMIGLTSLTVLLSKKLLIRHLLLFNILLSGLCSASEVLFRHITPMFMEFALASEIIAFIQLLNITPRLLAINIRATLLGCCHAIGQLGTTLSYLMFAFQPFSDIVGVAVGVSITMVLAILCLMLPDVDRRELPDLIEDMDYFSELSKPLRWATQKTDSPSHEEVQMRIYSFGSAGRQDSHDRSQDRIPAERIGFMKFCRRFLGRFRKNV